MSGLFIDLIPLIIVVYVKLSGFTSDDLSYSNKSQACLK